MNSHQLIEQVSKCVICEPHLPLGARPVIQFNPNARILIAGQAPGIKVHETGVPFNDASGNRLREWLGLTRDEFYDANNIAILPMGFCYPGRGKSGDLPPRKECAPAWREQLLAALPNIELTIVLGKYAQAYHLPETKKMPLTELVKSWREYWPNYLVLPHPSPRNNIWLKKNPWFEQDVLPELDKHVAAILNK
ncbi:MULTISPECIES: uracil-DNA glycosylase family protein [Pseudoalteromonas]|jgi:uracil-DNA glycosylase family 4|uniref:Uracil-DNA glycosylase family protein n=1 Tax=Pseudoalteromonas distincta TaxID=77608 RepID=A0A4V1HDX4_9GAMM|nr:MULTISPECIES: uracil-DNA glycosylase family protein [Pseudoalteromonas]MBA6409154.1 uracil-DNA glycosylase family protein [Pseudoalteromonas sp. 5Ae-yellow]MBB1280094.1 uracil-DNA glycosylase family protein [Pseudoalteromonas sp. SR41-1]MBB1296881.1 uracil-DNA glycosylase family protein [Pseudoalteromonas sp. SR41-7]MBB1305068.1 uracil-DNA glycosylase family protein [Pseudoalteromonas sp. SR43-5]MBB1346077.1 uracil-DNA glycosylase family protein [Pseudoalteromonas sp. SG45-2]|tara:strand:+ start:178871 stop:179452 length:582 start_codon:yes stop_codon:yes gene_type:complete